MRPHLNDILAFQAGHCPRQEETPPGAFQPAGTEVSLAGRVKALGAAGSPTRVSPLRKGKQLAQLRGAAGARARRQPTEGGDAEPAPPAPLPPPGAGRLRDTSHRCQLTQTDAAAVDRWHLTAAARSRVTRGPDHGRADSGGDARSTGVSVARDVAHKSVLRRHTIATIRTRDFPRVLKSCCGPKIVGRPSRAGSGCARKFKFKAAAA